VLYEVNEEVSKEISVYLLQEEVNAGLFIMDDICKQ
jgi:hypothetical protein